MRRFLLLVLVCCLFGGAETFGQQITGPKFTVKFERRKADKVAYTIGVDSGTVLNWDDSAFIMMVRYLARKVDTTLFGETIGVCPENHHRVAVMIGNPHKIFFAVRRDGKQVVLLLNGEKSVSGLLTVKNNVWSLEPKVVGTEGFYRYINGREKETTLGRFEFLHGDAREAVFDERWPEQ